MSRALVLNASWEPLSTTSLRRAVTLVLEGKAEIVHEAPGKHIRSRHHRFPVPVVIRRLHYVTVPYRTGMAITRRGILARDNNRCAYCGKHADTIDHVVPRSRGGAHTWVNVVAACRTCNGRKADRTPQEAGMRLRVKPREPRGVEALRLVFGRIDSTWVPYLTPQAA